MIRSVFYFASEDGYEDYALTIEERDQLKTIYEAAGTSFVIKTLPSDEEDYEPLYEPF
jgi:hypothetical protein